MWVPERELADRSCHISATALPLCLHQPGAIICSGMHHPAMLLPRHPPRPVALHLQTKQSGSSGVASPRSMFGRRRHDAHQTMQVNIRASSLDRCRLVLLRTALRLVLLSTAQLLLSRDGDDIFTCLTAAPHEFGTACTPGVTISDQGGYQLPLAFSCSSTSWTCGAALTALCVCTFP